MKHKLVWLSISAVAAAFLFVSSINAQTQASCQLSQNFSTYFSVGNANRSLTPRNVNDYGTVVGDGYDDTSFTEMGFFHWPDRNYTYYQHTSNGQPVQTFLYDRNNSGTTVGITLPGKTPMPFSLNGSTYTPLTMTIGGATYNNFYPFGINRWGTIVGMYREMFLEQGFRSLGALFRQQHRFGLALRVLDESVLMQAIQDIPTVAFPGSDS